MCGKHLTLHFLFSSIWGIWRKRTQTLVMKNPVSILPQVKLLLKTWHSVLQNHTKYSAGCVPDTEQGSSDENVNYLSI